MNYLISKVSKRLGIFGRTRGSISMHIAGIIYRSFILPVLDYCDNVWNFCGRINTGYIENYRDVQQGLSCKPTAVMKS